MSTPSYTLTVDGTSVTFHVSVGEGYTYYRLFFRRSDTTTEMILDGLPLTDMTADFTYTVSDLDPETSYTANVRYSTNTTTLEHIAIGAQTVTTGKGSRPSSWSWTTNIVTGATVPKYGGSLAPITASEWNSFCATINRFRKYKSLDEYSFTTVSQGTPMTTAIIYQAISAISGISGHGTLPTPSDAISASFWQRLAAALNAVT